MNKIEGKVLKYNGYLGIIIDSNNHQYLLLDNNVKNNLEIKEGDNVLFIPEVFKTVELEESVALFIEKKIN